MEEKKDARIISAFPMSGKTLVANSLPYYGRSYKVLDVSLTDFLWIKPNVKNPDFPANYVNCVRFYKESGLFDIILITTQQEVRAEMARSKIAYEVFYPDVSLKEEYLQACKNSKHRSNKFYEWLNENFEEEIKSIEEDTFPKKIKTTHKQYLLTFIESEIRRELKNKELEC